MNEVHKYTTYEIFGQIYLFFDNQRLKRDEEPGSNVVETTRCDSPNGEIFEPWYDVLSGRDPICCSGNAAQLGVTAFHANGVLLSHPPLQFVTLGCTSKLPRYTNG